MTKRWGHVLLLTAFWALGSASGLMAISARTVNLAEMVQYSGRVFYGRCIAVKDLSETAGGMPVRLYRFEVREGLLGVEAGEIVEVRQLRSGHGAMSIPGLPSYRKGEEVLLFLYPDSRFGLTSPVGLEQGLFRPEAADSGELVFRNGLDNRNLLSGLGAQTAAQFGLAGADLSGIQSDQPISLSVLRKIVAKVEQHLRSTEARVQ